jgi:hypothetical protein
MIVGFAGQAGSGKDTSADFLVKNHGFVKVAFADEIKRTCARIYPKMTREHLWGPSERRNKFIEDYPRPHGPWLGIGGTHRCACCNVAQDPDDRFEPSHPSQCYLTARFALQQLGTEWGRTCYPATWTDITMNASNLLLGRGGTSIHAYSPWKGLSVVPGHQSVRGVVISDLRWPDGNEGKAIRDAGGILVKLLRGDGLGGAKAAHQSETAVAGTPDSFYDEVIDNRDTPDGVFSLEQLNEQLGVMAKKYSDRRKA